MSNYTKLLKKYIYNFIILFHQAEDLYETARKFGGFRRQLPIKF